MSASTFVTEWLPRIRRELGPEPRAVDVAMGRGRHTLAIARAGFRTFGVDVGFDAVREGRASAAAGGVALAVWCADLAIYPLPRRRFDLIVVARYLDRALFPSLRDALAPGGAIIYETFTIAQRRHGVGPTSPDHLLRPDELRERFAELELVFYEEVAAPEAVARLVARRTP